MTEHFESTQDLVIIGLAARTSPADAARDIPAHWQRFMQEGQSARLAGLAADAHLYAVYCDYESDHHGPYTLVLGVAVDAAAPVPPGLRRVRVPAGRFARLPVAGDPAAVIWRGWAHLNGEWGRAHPRRYIADFERYDAQLLARGEARADLVVGLA